MTEKKKNSSMKKNDNKKPSYKFDHYKSLHTWQDTPVTDNWKDQLAQDLFLWARDNEEAYKMSQFYLAKGINNRDFARWCETHEHLKMAKEAALVLIGNRREIGGLKKRLDATIVLTSMAKYDPEWKELAEWRAQLKSESENKSETKIIVMEQYNPPVKEDKPTPEQVARKARNGALGKNLAHKRPTRKK